ncbi:unannotated protein [freshwater metagenome]|uniref:Unannotated protein n=1 Tax=freshwater metagenome TaxID=449393 RepID=A0A6J6XJF4_9ZZZZ
MTHLLRALGTRLCGRPDRAVEHFNLTILAAPHVFRANLRSGARG